MRNLILAFVVTLCLACSCCECCAQTAPASQTTQLPIGLVATINYNQLGSPQVTGSVGAIYPLSSVVSGIVPVSWLPHTNGMYGVTAAEFYPTLVTDPVTKKSFYSVSTNFQQEVHQDFLDVGKWRFLVGGGAGPAFSSSSGSTTSGLTINLSADLAGTAVYQFKPAISAVFSLRALYISNAGWNPIPRVGLIFNLSNLQKAKN